MNPPGENAFEAYVRAALALHGYAFDAAQIAEIIVQFARIAALAATIEERPLSFAAEPLPLFRP